MFGSGHTSLFLLKSQFESCIDFHDLWILGEKAAYNLCLLSVK